MNPCVAILFSSLILCTSAQQTFSFGTFDASNQNQFKYNLNAPGYNNPPNGALTLTQDRLGDAGSIFYTKTVTLSSSASFSTAFSFMMDGGAGPMDADGTLVGADGIVFIINSQSNNGGTAGYGIGYAGISNSVGVEFDTWYNPDFGDVNGNHVGIDLNGEIRSVQQRAATDLFNDGRQYYAWVDFNGANNTLEARYSLTSTRPADAFISRVVDLAAILGKSEVFIGFSAATGGDSNRHRILAWTFSNSYQPISTVPTATCGNNRTESGEDCDGGRCCTSTCKFSQTAACFCGRQQLADGQMEYYCNANGGFYQCLGGVYASQSRNMTCGAGTQCGCDVGAPCSCNLQQSPCVWSGTRQQC